MEYGEEYEFSEGSETCQDMCSHFLRIMGGSGDEKRLLTCFVNCLRHFVKRKYEETYWESHRPT